MERSLRLPAVLGALEGALLAVVGILALSSFLLARVGAVAEGERALVVLQMDPGSFFLLAVGFSAAFGAVTAYLARTVVPVFQPDLQVRGGPTGALALGAVLGAVLGTVAAFLGVSVVGEQTDAGFQIPLLPALVLVTVAGAVFGSATAVGVYAFSEPTLEGEEAEEVRAVRRRLLASVAMPVASFLLMAVIVVGLGLLFLRFHLAAPVLGMVVAGGILAFAGLITSRPRRRVPVGEALLALAGIAVVVLVIVAVLNAAGVGEGEAEQGAEEGASQSPTSTATSVPSEEGS